ncbi:hypothetical protein J4Q44_G00236570 [Coregonus suidteri]|uniref:Uncharacterized protein n=1 Tax=Coregonus suidteri TaxID=861788 RepID=A0AAN8LE60_9TELE
MGEDGVVDRATLEWPQFIEIERGEGIMERNTCRGGGVWVLEEVTTVGVGSTERKSAEEHSIIHCAAFTSLCIDYRNRSERVKQQVVMVANSSIQSPEGGKAAALATG